MKFLFNFYASCFKYDKNTKHAAYADHLSYVGKLKNMLTFWKKVYNFSSKIGYFTNAKKLWLTAKPEK